ncbi:MAG: AbrB/MazE/SpoVT family DNA-binding domain-containing protein [bacterium]
MTTKIRKWGNSLALKIPKSFANATKIDEGAEIKLSLSEDKIIITKKQTPKYTLKELVSKINDNNIHKEINFDPPMGKELL